MIIIFRRIPENTQEHEIESFIKPILKRRIFQKTGHIEHIEILLLKNTQNNTLDFNGLVTIYPDEAAERVIQKLNRKIFKGKHIQVREYIHRLWQNDPRDNKDRANTKLMKMRKADRRQSKLEVINKTSVKFSSSKQFHRVL